MEHKQKLKLFEKIRTVDERDMLLTELDFLISNLYEHAGLGLDSALRSGVRAWVASAIREGFPEASDVSIIESYLKNLKEELSSLKIFKLKIAFEPTDSSIDKFSNYLKKNIEGGVILDTEIDPKIYGGAEITFNGEYRDYSLKRLFESEYKAHESELLKLINKNV